MTRPNISQQIDEDTKNAPDVDMLIVRREHLVFCWASADEVIHVFNYETGKQLPRIVFAEDVWTMDTLESFAEHYCQTHPRALVRA